MTLASQRAAAEPRPRRFTVAEYHRMGRVGILRPDERTELLDGIVVAMTPVSDSHAAAVKRTNHFFGRRVPEDVIVSVQDPIRLDDLNEPQPDVALLRPRADFYARATPTAEDVLLLVEVAVHSLEYDLGPKAAAYAKAGIRDYWVADLDAGQLIILRLPAQSGYQSVTRLQRGETVAPLALPDLTVPVEAILGPAEQP
ncbi:MAG: Uma2 family endonuclease [Chloroflexota bacterium]|nr:Uma2 family endonuclease [Dehalococcoidia bacterium]MDW8255173.1 Uma2 family endonuclease [Chloroflexota bacterium]